MHTHVIIVFIFAMGTWVQRSYCYPRSELGFLPSSAQTRVGTRHLSLAEGAAGRGLATPSASQAEVWSAVVVMRARAGLTHLLLCRTLQPPPPPLSLLPLTFVSVIGNLAQVNEVGADGHVVDLV